MLYHVILYYIILYYIILYYINHLFQRLPSGKRFRAIRTKTSRHYEQFFPHGSGAHKQAPCTTLTLPHHPQLPPPLHIIYNCTLAQHVPITLLLYILYSILFYSISYILLFFYIVVLCTNDTKTISCMCKHTWQ